MQIRKRTASTGLVYGVVSLVILGIVLILASIIYFAFGNSIPTGLVNATQQSTINQYVLAGSQALSLLRVLLIVGAGGLVIAAVFAYFTFGRRVLKFLHVTK
jgi:hypothetical protein